MALHWQRARPVKRALQPFDVTLRHGRRYQWLRRAFLTLSVSLTVVLPLVHLRRAVPLVGAPTALWLGVFDLVDPLEVLAVALRTGLPWKLVLTVLPGVVLVLFLGRFFCGWACPYLPVLAVSNSARALFGRLGVTLPDLRLPRRTNVSLMVLVLLVGVVSGVQVVPLIYPPAILGRALFQLVFFGALGTGGLVVLGAFLFDTFVSRAGFCRSLCPGGAMFSTLGAASPVRIHNERSKCTDCTVCDVVCNLGQSPMTQRLDGGCERCGRCIAACPTQALSWRLE